VQDAALEIHIPRIAGVSPKRPGDKQVAAGENPAPAKCRGTGADSTPCPCTRALFVDIHPVALTAELRRVGYCVNRIPRAGTIKIEVGGGAGGESKTQILDLHRGSCWVQLKDVVGALMKCDLPKGQFVAVVAGGV